jgi:hypothetical protein
VPVAPGIRAFQLLLSPQDFMLKKLNAILFIAELAFIGAPLIILALFGAVLTISGVPGVKPDHLPIKQLAMLTAFIGLCGFWGMSAAFAYGGVERVGHTSRSVRIATAIGVLMTFSFALYGRFPQADPFFAIVMSGIPLLIPLAHIFLCVIVDRMKKRQGQHDAVI